MRNAKAEKESDKECDYDQWPLQGDRKRKRMDSSISIGSEIVDGTTKTKTTTTTIATSTPRKESSEIFKKLTHTYILEIYKILENHKEVSYTNALEINKEMQNKLVAVRTQLQKLHNKVVNRFAQNQETLIKNMEKIPFSRDRFGKTIRGRTFYIRGNTFFKDENMRCCPNNEDYTTRSRNGEVFPMDFDLVARHIWSINDKMGIVRGIKEQIITEKSLSIRISNKNVQLTDLLKQVGEEFKIDWGLISKHNLKYRHTPTSCKAMWEVYLHPSLNHDAFSETENERLLQAAQKYNNWATIAKEVGRRSDYQCFLQYHTTLYTRSRGWQRWDKKDDKRLLDAIEASKCNGVINWTQVAFQFPQKSKASLQQRYQYAINPAVSHAPFTPEEDLLLLATIEEYGKNFAKIPRTIFPNRSIVQLRSRYKNTLQHRDKNQPWTLKDDEFLMEFVKENGASSWKKLEEAFESRHTRIACRQRYTVIQKHLSNNENATLNTLIRRGPRNLRSDVTPQNWQQKVEQLRINPTAIEDEAEARKLNNKRKKKPSSTKPSEGESDNSNKRNKTPRINTKKTKIDEEVTQLGSDNEQIEQDQNENKNEDVINNLDSSSSTSLMTQEVNNKKEQNNKNKPNIHRKTKNPIYVARLRANNLSFHNFLKYAYHFRFGRNRETTETPENNVGEFEKAKECLGFQMPEKKVLTAIKKRNKRKSKRNSIPEDRNENVREFIKNSIKPATTIEPSNSYQVPPNSSTLTALRALCALSADHAKMKETKKTEETENSETSYEPTDERGLEAINRFRQRFRNLFYKTAVLSRLPPSTFEQNPFINQFQNQTENGTTTEFHITTVDETIKSSVDTESTPKATSSIETATSLQPVKIEFTDETEISAPIIKTEIDFEAYKELN